MSCRTVRAPIIEGCEATRGERVEERRYVRGGGEARKKERREVKEGKSEMEWREEKIGEMSGKR
jgi:hypothetical protein